MKPMKIVRNSSSYRYKLQRKRRIQKTILLGSIAVLIICVIILLATRGGGSDPAPSGQPAAQQQLVQQLNNGDAAKMSLSAGETCMLTLPDGVDIRQASFACENSSIIRVDAAGRVDALQEGAAKVVATARGFSSVCEFTVTPAVKDAARTELTTAVTANGDVAAANAKKGTDDLYRITVNRRTNTVTVYTYDEKGDYTVPVRAMVCSCGTGGDDITPTGNYAIYFREEWHPLYGDVFGLYVSGFEGPYLFHSVPYHSEDHGDLKTEEFNKLGTNASQGCVRMMVSDVKWVYDNCAMNTPVKVIDSDESADPLGKPAVVKIPASSGWDPTDPDPKNPYKGKTSVISGVTDVSVSMGASFDPMQGVTAKDMCGNDITDRVWLKGAVITEKPGTYFLTYVAVDAFGQTTEADRMVVVS